MAIRVTCDDQSERSEPGRWAVSHLRGALLARGLDSAHGAVAEWDEFHIVAGLQRPADGVGAGVAESFTVEDDRESTVPRLTVTGADERGLVYGILELADIVTHASDPLTALREVNSGVHAPVTAVRSVLRTLVSDEQDLPWFRDGAFWEDYLTHLATHRINRFQLALGMQYNYSHDPGAKDNYLAFAYPFLLSVDGFDVYAEGVDEAERDANLAALQHISTESARRGIHFQLGLWNHAYDFPESPQQRYPIRGLEQADHAAYCRAALKELLIRCPALDGVTVRVHYEGGIHEPTHTFWQTVLSGLAEIGRPVEIDMHSKGVDSRILDAARATGGPLVISAKYWAEHQGLPYHQAAVRDMESALPAREGLSGVTRSIRRFTRYGYGDFLDSTRDYGFLFRIWPGTQRVLAWGDPEQVAGIARASTAIGARGVELCEPLTFLGRKTTGSAGGRQPYADPSLQTDGDPWVKHAHTYRLWGRLLYDPQAPGESLRRALDSEHGAAAPDLDLALRAASRILPLVTTYHGPSASNNFYWPEMHTTIPLAHHRGSDVYAFDTPEPHTLGAVSPFDPQLFQSIDDCADDLLAGRADARYGPRDVSRWLGGLVQRADRHLSAAAGRSAGSAQFRRLALDIAVLARLGAFFAATFDAGLSYTLARRTGSVDQLRDAVERYSEAVAAFTAVVGLTSGTYARDLAFGDRPTERGHWSDRLPALEQDLADLRAELDSLAAGNGSQSPAVPLPARGRRPHVRLDVAPTFEPGNAVEVRVTLTDDLDSAVHLHYRQLNQAREWRTAPMPARQGHRHAEIPGTYTDSTYPLQVYVTVQTATGEAWIVPGLDDTLTNVPYVVLQPEEGTVR